MVCPGVNQPKQSCYMLHHFYFCYLQMNESRCLLFTAQQKLKQQSERSFQGPFRQSARLGRTANMSEMRDRASARLWMVAASTSGSSSSHLVATL